LEIPATRWVRSVGHMGVRTYLYSRIPSILMRGITTVKLSKKTRDRLAEFGTKNETYENIIVRLMESYTDNSEAQPTRRHDLRTSNRSVLDVRGQEERRNCRKNRSDLRGRRA